MPIVVTHPGKLGDLLWAMATVKGLSMARAERIHLVTSPRCQTLVQYLEGLPYIASARVEWNWEITGDCPGLQPWRCPSVAAGVWTPHRPGTESGMCYPVQEDAIHLGLREWPVPNLFQCYAPQVGVTPSPLWLPGSRPEDEYTGDILVAWTDEWVELKVGLTEALAKAFPLHRFRILTQGHGFCRLHTEFALPFQNVVWEPCTISAIPRWIAKSRLLITDKSSIRVMAVGQQHPTVVIEPSQPRHNIVFDPPSEAGAREWLINGFDAREAVDEVRKALAHPLR